MYNLPEPPAATAAGQATRDAAINEAADEMLTALNAAIAREKQQTSYNNPNLPSHQDGPQIGTAPPVPQPDSRIVPAWALGIAVASIGVGAGITGIGCGVWLACQGFAAVTLNSVLMVTLPFAGLATLITAVGGAISKARTVNVTNVRNGPTYEEHHTDSRRSVWQKNIHKK